ncbi:MAG: MBOAT family protein, partial [Lachnospiraceae bacterium]|nr:MBOAT family protein [Lachnospiraceae bacterium]
MTFSSIPFLCAFFPVVVILYYLIPFTKLKNCFLIAASLLFYAYGEGIYVLLMLLCVCFNYLTAILLDHSKKGKKLLLILAIVMNLGVLGIYKYAEMIIVTVNRIAGTEISVPAIHLPIGISFFIFQALSYVIDVYQNKVKADKSFIRILLYISFFPQLIAGPIIKYHDISEQLGRRKLSLRRSCQGVRRFIVGLSKKVLIANTMGLTADYVFSMQYEELGMLLVWIGAIAFFFQIYFDFSGY